MGVGGHPGSPRPTVEFPKHSEDVSAMTRKLQIRERLILERAKQLGISEPSDAEVEALMRAELRAEARRAIDALEPITLEDLAEAAAKFERIEPRGGFYSLARGLVEKDFAARRLHPDIGNVERSPFLKRHFRHRSLSEHTRRTERRFCGSCRIHDPRSRFRIPPRPRRIDI